jgi:hypothetical protein
MASALDAFGTATHSEALPLIHPRDMVYLPDGTKQYYPEPAKFAAFRPRHNSSFCPNLFKNGDAKGIHDVTAAFRIRGRFGSSDFAGLRCLRGRD